jgi:hypothetical protein
MVDELKDKKYLGAILQLATQTKNEKYLYGKENFFKSEWKRYSKFEIKQIE